uniref:Uncharacterized protein n=1 Tax=Anguilla anguilla TaxID=7936 RepID=A0A0E9Q4V4_ANGAN
MGNHLCTVSDFRWVKSLHTLW